MKATAAAKLVDTLKEKGPFTVFAPTDEAFKALLAKLGTSEEEFLARPDLADILKLHIVKGKQLLSSDLQEEQSLETLQGNELKVVKEGEAVKVGPATVLKSDLIGSNGVIHSIDMVLLPETSEEGEGEGEEEDPISAFDAQEANKTIIDLVKESGDFKMLLKAIAAAKLLDTLKENGPFTFFAPTDEAFKALLAKLGMSEEQFLARPDLADILKLHIIKGKQLLSSDLQEEQSLETLQGDELNVVKEGEAVKVGPATVLKSDLIGSNGVIHSIDTVLLPETSEDGEGEGEGAGDSKFYAQFVLP